LAERAAAAVPGALPTGSLRVFQLFVSFNGAELPAGKLSEFGLCSVLLQIPESERNGR
jgi:hypothetical protein